MPRSLHAKIIFTIITAILCVYFLLQMSNADDRVATARARCGSVVKALLEKAKLPSPAGEIFIRAFKRENELEVWGRKRTEPFRLINLYRVTARSGGPGTKRVQGDLQVPEGFYEIDRFNPKSNFHLSLGLNYPNASDRILSDKENPGDDIFIHGNRVSIGCLPLGDEAIEEVYLMALDSKTRPIRVHTFPARMNAVDWKQWSEEQIKLKPELKSFWAELQPGFDLFEKTKRIPKISVTSKGTYICKPGAD